LFLFFSCTLPLFGSRNISNIIWNPSDLIEFQPESSPKFIAKNLDSKLNLVEFHDGDSKSIMFPVPVEHIPPYLEPESQDNEDADDDDIIIEVNGSNTVPLVLTAYKCVDKKIHPVSTSFPIDCQVT
jgi:hypothetical protein